MTRSPRRWVVLGVYALAVALTQALWLNFAPLISLIQQRYSVSEELASALLFIFPLVYVLVSIPAGKVIDRRGYRFSVAAGTVLMALAACVRIADSTFAALMIGQVGIAVAQPFIVNAISKLVADWFEPQQGVIATGLGTMGMFIGMAVGMAATPPLVEALSLRTAMATFAGLAALAAVLCIAVVRPNPQAAAPVAGAEPGVLSVLRDRALWRVFALAFLGMGEFNGLTTWLEKILAPAGISVVDAGYVGGVLIAGGIVGAIVIPALCDTPGKRKPFLLACVVGALATVYPLATAQSVGMAMAFAAAHGFFFLPAFALLLDMSAQLAGNARAGAATSVLMLAGNLGAVAVIVAMPVLKGDGPSFGPGVSLLLVLLMIGAVLAATLPRAAPNTTIAAPG
jgi:predicted MFS family arabinose efflux permease